MNGSGRGVGYDLRGAEEIFGDSWHKGGISAEKELMLAILADAIDCIWKYSRARDGRSARLFRDARQWLFGDDSNETFSFINICDALSLDPSYIRRGIVGGINKRRGSRAEDPDTHECEQPKMHRNFKRSTRSRVRSRPLKA